MWLLGLLLCVFLGGFCLGVPEGLLVSLACLRHPGPCVIGMVLANSLSWWIAPGVAAFAMETLRWLTPFGLYSATWMSMAAFLVMCVATALAEWPFVLLCLGTTARHRKFRAAVVCLVVQAFHTVGFTVLVSSAHWRGMVLDLCPGLRIVPPSAVGFPSGVDVYCLSASGAQVVRIGRGCVRTQVAEMPSTNRCAFLWFRPASPAGVWDLVAKRLDGSAPFVVVAGAHTNLGAVAEAEAPHEWWGKALRVGSARHSDWEFRWSSCREGLSGENRTTGESVAFSFTPLLSTLPVQRAIHLPGDKVLFQLGRDELCLLDVARREVGVWQQGIGAVAIATAPTEGVESR